MRVHLLLLMPLLAIAAAVGGAELVGARETPPPPGPPRPVRFPTPVEQRFTNGLRVMVLPRHKLPLVAAQLLIKTGGEADPPQRPGVARLTADVLTQGTSTRTAAEVARTIDALGASLSATAEWDASRVSVSATTPRFGAALAVLADVVRHPTFVQSETDRRKQQQLSDLQVSYHDPTALAHMVMTRVLYGGAAYGHPLDGTPESVQAIRPADLVRFHRAHFRPDNAILILGGDIEPPAAFAAARRNFGEWRAPAPSPHGMPARTATRKPPTPHVVIVDEPDAGRAAVVLGRITIERADPHYYQGVVTNSVLSGYSGRLNREIRIKRGLSYGAGSFLDPRRLPGPFIADSLVDNAKVAAGAAVLLDTVRGLGREPVEPDELKPREAAVIGEFGRAAETVGGLLEQVGSLALYGIPQSELNRYVTRVEAVTPTDVQQFARLWLDPQPSLVIVGNSRLFLDEFRRRFAGAEVIPFARLDLNQLDLRKHP